MKRSYIKHKGSADQLMLFSGQSL